MDATPMRSIAYYIRTIHHVMGRQMDARLREQGLTKSQFDVLWFLHQPHERPIIQRDIQDFFHISNPTVTGILNRLEEKELIRRVRSETDRRSYYIEPTEKAEALRQQMMACAMESEQMMATWLSPEENAELESLLGRILKELLERSPDSTIPDCRMKKEENPC